MYSKEEIMYNDCSKYTEPYENLLWIVAGCAVVIFLCNFVFPSFGFPDKYKRWLYVVSTICIIVIPIVSFISGFNLLYISNNKRGIIDDKIKKCESILTVPSLILGGLVTLFLFYVGIKKLFGIKTYTYI